ncbi:hypothetical protein [Tabrizicola sp. YIM 78059]|uniref:hypothetical protein n=1 Tax=Tabrizicola sp. YIM 78059 TaxID=2529861 RepID=UPI0010AA28B1|nr:hypothetical protein [Tabrizicola sp. YIM 78059]
MMDEDRPGWKLIHSERDELAEVRRYQGGGVELVPDPLRPGTFELRPEITFWEDIARLADECDEILKAAGLPPIAGIGREPYRNAQTFSEEWFAAKIGAACFHILAGRETLSDWTLERTLTLGHLLEDRTWRRLHKADAVRGKKTLAAGRSGGIQRKGKLGSDTPAILEEMTRLIDKGLTTSAAAGHVAKKFDRKRSGVLSLWSRHKK